MSQPHVVGKRRALSASAILDAAATDLSQIKHEDRLTFADIGRVLGKSEDMAAKYCDGSATMDFVTYTLARDQWNGRFTGTIDAMVSAGKLDNTTDRNKQTLLTKALLDLSIALEDDDECCPRDVRKHRRSLEAAREAIDSLLGKLELRAA